MMSATDLLWQEPAAQAIGWALLQFIWQGALIGIFTAAALGALRHSAADIRYVVATIGLTLMLTMPVMTAVQTWRAGPGTLGEIAVTSSARAFIPAAGRARDAEISAVPYSGQRDPVARQSDGEGWTLTPWLPALFLGWLVGVALLTLRLLSGWLWVQRLKSHATKPASVLIDAMAGRLARRLHISRTVTFLESAIVQVPTVIGWIRPVVLVPASALAGLSPAQLETILAHELAHIRRHDYLVNLLQTLVETLLFYHPAVWWVSRRIRIEREHCCDDLAVSLCGDPVAYARALADLEELRRGGDQFVLAANGGSLLGRVRRLLGAPSHAGRGPGWLAATIVLLVIAAIAAGAAGSDMSADQSALSASPAVPSTASAQAARAVAQPAMATAAAITQAPAAQATVVAEASRAVEARSQDLVASAEGLVAAAQPVIAEAAGVAEASMQGAAAALAEADATLGATMAASPDFLFAKIAQSKGNYTWSNKGEKLSISYEGSVEFTDDDADVKSLSPGGYLKIKEGGLLGSRTVEFRADASGRLERRFWVGTSERPFEPEGRQWLAQTLPRFIRQSGLGAPARVARILRQKGPDGVLEEISLIEGSWSKALYFTELLKTEKLDPQVVERVLERAGREIDSDFELASLLIKSADRLLVTDATRKAYFRAARSIDSDFEMRRVYSSALKRGPLAPDLLAGLLEASTEIDSDFEAASLLIDVARVQPLDDRTRPAFFNVLDTVESDFEHRRVLGTLLARGDVSAATRNATLDSAMQIGSDFEKASMLMSVFNAQGLEASIRPQFFRVVETIDSAFERGRVLKAVIESSDDSTETLLGVLRATKAMGSNFEASQVLMAVAAKYPLSGEARQLYIDAAESLGDFEQGRALAALVKSERRK